jgi:hypothetical protein
MTQFKILWFLNKIPGDIYVTVTVIDITQPCCYFCIIHAVNCSYLKVKERRDTRNASIYFLEGDASYVFSYHGMKSFVYGFGKQKLWFAALFLYIL